MKKLSFLIFLYMPMFFFFLKKKRMNFVQFTWETIFKTIKTYLQSNSLLRVQEINIYIKLHYFSIFFCFFLSFCYTENFIKLIYLLTQKVGKVFPGFQMKVNFETAINDLFLFNFILTTGKYFQIQIR